MSALVVPDVPQFGEYLFGDTCFGSRTKAGATALPEDTAEDTFPSFDVGDLVPLAVAFTAPYSGHDAPIATDPGAVSVSIEQPDGTVTTWTYLTGSEIVKTGTGAYRVEFTADEAGRWTYAWSGSGAVQAVAEGEFYVRARQTI
jgi:hypothetical protein